MLYVINVCLGLCVSAGFVRCGAQMSSQEWKVEEVTIL